jgi:hypothetical protein
MVQLAQNWKPSTPTMSEALRSKARVLCSSRPFENRLLSYFRARYYDPSTGEFTSPDPLEYVDGMSLYRGYFLLGSLDPQGKMSRRVDRNEINQRLRDHKLLGVKPRGRPGAGFFHPDNGWPIDRWEPDLPMCPKMEGGCLRHCSASCRLKHFLLFDILVHPIAQWGGDDLPWQSTRKYEDVIYNWYGTECGNDSPRNSCVSCCKELCTIHNRGVCCKSNPRLDKYHKDCKDEIDFPCPKDPMESWCRVKCRSEHPNVLENDFFFVTCMDDCKREVKGQKFDPFAPEPVVPKGPIFNY